MSRFLMRFFFFAALVAGIGYGTDFMRPVIGQEKPNPQISPAPRQNPSSKNSIPIKDAKVGIIDQVQLAAARTGILEFVEFREGDQVQAGQKVAGLKDDVAQAELKSAQAQAENDIEIRYAQAANAYAEMDLKKSEAVNLKNRRTVSEIEIEEKKLATIKTKLQIDQAKWQFEVNQTKADQAEAVLKQFSVETPFDGVVTQVLKSKGEAVREGETILEITSTKRMKVEGYLHYTDAWRVKQGDPVTVRLNVEDPTLEAAKQTFRGRIKYVDLEVAFGDVLVWAEVENADNLMRAGLDATMTIELLGGKDPKAAAAR